MYRAIPRQIKIKKTYIHKHKTVYSSVIITVLIV